MGQHLHVQHACMPAARCYLQQHFLSCHRCSSLPHLYPGRSVCVVTWRIVLQVLRLFAIHNILSAPIFEANTSHCSGFLDLVDILQAVLSWFNVRADAADRTDKLKKAGRKLLTEKIRGIKLANDGHLVYRNGSSTTLLEVSRCF